MGLYDSAFYTLASEFQPGVLLGAAGGGLHNGNAQLLTALAVAQQQQQFNSNGFGAHPTHQHWSSPSSAAAVASSSANLPSHSGSGSSALAPPCSTIFIGNLGSMASSQPNVVEEELRSLFAMFPGFCRMRMHTKGGGPVAFVEFGDIAQASAALQAMQGYALVSAAGAANGGIRIEFAKTRMGDTSQLASSASAFAPNCAQQQKGGEDQKHHHHFSQR
uniref:RRM domain-containing protein n=1 Tax=Globodera rostochiensis TaxID=31243 RepID=A0A914HFK5_GLORO